MELEKLPTTHQTGLVFGSGINAVTGEVGGVLQSRLDTATELYRNKKITKIILSGDSQSLGHDEVTPMARYLVRQGIPEAVLTLDTHGLGTYESCYRLVHQYGNPATILITNAFHLARAVTTCRSLGSNAIGFEVADPNNRFATGQRESLASLKMLIDLYIAPPRVSEEL
jgi:vancomycin permeability regulator SanA